MTMLSLDQLEQKARSLRGMHVGLFTNTDQLKNEVFSLFEEIVEHIRRLENLHNANEKRIADVEAVDARFVGKP